MKIFVRHNKKAHYSRIIIIIITLLRVISNTISIALKNLFAINFKCNC